MGFMDNIRRPKNLEPWADTGGFGPGETDPYTQAIDFMKQDRRREDANLEDRYNGGGYGRISRGSARNVGQGLLQGGSNEGQMGPTTPKNVVYDMGPEMAQKRFNLEKDRMNMQQKRWDKMDASQSARDNDDYIDNRRKFNLTEDKTRTDMTRPDLDFMNVPGGNIVGIDKRTGKRLDTGMASGVMSDEAKITAQNAARHADVTQNGVNRLIWERQQAETQRAIADAANQTRLTAETEKNRPAPVTAQQEMSNKLQQLMIDNPAVGSSIIAAGNGFTIKPTATVQEREAIRQALYPPASTSSVKSAFDIPLTNELANPTELPGLSGKAGMGTNRPAVATPKAAPALNQSRPPLAPSKPVAAKPGWKTTKSGIAYKVG